MGALVIYVAAKGSIRVTLDGGEWQTCEVAVIQPSQPHQVVADARIAYLMKLEAETLDHSLLPGFLTRSGAVDAPQFVERVRKRTLELFGRVQAKDVSLGNFDQFFFEELLTARVLDHRIRQIVQLIKQTPSSRLSAEACAEMTHLSVSRFLHLFKEEVGASFRAFCMWKRARSILLCNGNTGNLTNVALDAGYPDSTHFSHCIRKIYGLRPTDIFIGLRDSSVYAMI